MNGLTKTVELYKSKRDAVWALFNAGIKDPEANWWQYAYNHERTGDLAIEWIDGKPVGG